MRTQKKRTRRKPAGRLIDVARVISVGQDRRTGEVVLKFNGIGYSACVLDPGRSRDGPSNPWGLPSPGQRPAAMAITRRLLAGKSRLWYGMYER